MRTRPLALGLFALLAAATLPDAPAQEAKPKKVEVGPRVTLEVGKTRKVIVDAVVCRRKGALEGLLTRAKNKDHEVPLPVDKTHEYMLAADIDARHLHAALLLAGAKAGTPAKFDPKFQLPTGTAIRISLRYKKDGKTLTVPASEWISDSKTKKPLEKDWVFGGSKLIKNPNVDGPKAPPYLLANQGHLVCVVNIESALLDLPIRSTKNFTERVFEANTSKIPAENTKVEVIFEPVLEKKKD